MAISSLLRSTPFDAEPPDGEARRRCYTETASRGLSAHFHHTSNASLVVIVWNTLLPIAAILVAIFVLETDFHSTPKPVLVGITPVRAFIIRAHAPTMAYSAMVRIHIASHAVHHSAHLLPLHASHPVTVALHPPIAAESRVFSALPVLLARLLRLLGRALGLHGNSLWLAGSGLAGSGGVPLILGE